MWKDKKCTECLFYKEVRDDKYEYIWGSCYLNPPVEGYPRVRRKSRDIHGELTDWTHDACSKFVLAKGVIE